MRNDGGRVAVVTGGASGIGEGIVRRFVADGGLVDRTLDAWNRTIEVLATSVFLASVRPLGS
jgi:NADP-dependent 3-hydroxy acid dehydrogenase YdfG